MNAPVARSSGGRRVRVARLAAAVERMAACRTLVDGIQDDLDALRSTRLTAVAGEEQLVTALRGCLATADETIRHLTSGGDESPLAYVERIEAVLVDPLWELAERSADELARRRGEVDAASRLIEEEFGSMRLNIDRLARAVRAATEVHLEDFAEQRALAAEVEGRFRTGDLELKLGHYDNVAVSVSHAKALLLNLGLAAHDETSGVVTVDAARLEDYTQRFEARINAAAERDSKLTKRSELIIISGVVSEQRVPYKVLLRRPGYRDIQETNLYDDIEVLGMDQDLFRSVIDEISDGALTGIRSAAGLLGGVDGPPSRTEPASGSTSDSVARTDPVAEQPTQAQIRRAAPVASAGPDTGLLGRLEPAQRLAQVGRRMYGLLIPDAMQRLIEETREFPLTITSNNPELPWELLHDGEGFLCLKRMFARMPAGQTFPRRTRESSSLAPTRDIRVLLIHSEAGEQLPNAAEEITAIQQTLSRMDPRPKVTLLSGSEVTSARLTDELSLGNYDVVHYTGHAGFDPDRPHLSYLLLPSLELFRAERVQRLLEGHPVVFLNACESSRAARQESGATTGGTVAQAQGLGSAFVYGGAQACVGSLWPVFDDTAAEFAITFYENLIARRQRVGEALRLARLRSFEARTDAITWAAYALYGDPGYRLGSPVTTTWAAAG